MSRTMTNDISRFLEAGIDDIYTENFQKFPKEYDKYTTQKTSEKKVAKFDSVGNLQAAQEKIEGNAIQYGKIEQAYQTTCTMKTWANGFQYTMESERFDQYDVILQARAKELARTMLDLAEDNAVYWLDNADNAAVTLADGVPWLSNSHPLKNCGSKYNDTLATGALSNPDNVKTALNMFNGFYNHAGGKMKSTAKRIITHKNNMWTVEEIFGSDKKAYESSNTKNVLPPVDRVYLNYLANQNYWFLEDTDYEHELFVRNMDVKIEADRDIINTKDYYVNAVEIYNTCVVPNIGFVGSTG